MERNGNETDIEIENNCASPLSLVYVVCTHYAVFLSLHRPLKKNPTTHLCRNMCHAGFFVPRKIVHFAMATSVHLIIYSLDYWLL